MPKAEQNATITALNSRADTITGHPRFMPVEGDAMAPTLTFRHLAAVVPVREFCGEGIYALNVFRDQVDYFRCVSTGPGGAWLSRDNSRYNGYPLSWDDFETALLGKVAAICSVIEPTLFGGVGIADTAFSPDAELVSLCSDYLRGQRPSSQPVTDTGDRQADLEAMRARYQRDVEAGIVNDRLLLRMAALRAHTDLGMKAKAQIVRAWLGGGRGELTPPPHAGSQERVAWSLTSDLLGRA